MVKHFFYSFDQLQICLKDIEELMGFEPGESPEPFPELIETGLKEAPSLCSIQGGFKIFEKIRIDIKSRTILVEDQCLSPGEIVVTQLKNATSGALFACTAGTGITDYAKQMTLEGDSFLSYVMDVIGSVTVDKAAEKIQEEIFTFAVASNKGVTDPFSPGYCNWSVAEQQKLFSLLPPRFCGIILSDSSLMHPIKSVSGITGIGLSCARKGYQCNWCDDHECIYGKIRRRKMSKKNP
jgi:hypothetical protein